MQELPHHYKVAATAGPVGEVELASSADDLIHSAPPAEYGGPGNLWSPETLLVSAVADCFILTFRAIARASKLDWSTVSCDVTGTLDKVDGVTQFTEFTIKVVLGVDESTNESKALRILEKAEEGCLITNSLSGSAHLSAEVVIA